MTCGLRSCDHGCQDRQSELSEINHDLNFLIRHFPSAYAVDRTQGANLTVRPQNLTSGDAVRQYHLQQSADYDAAAETLTGQTSFAQACGSTG